MRNHVFVCIVALIGMAACAPIQHDQKLSSTAVGVAGPGDLIARVDRQRNLQNAFGSADIFGRKTLEGFSELRFAGVDEQGRVVLFRTNTNIETNETTMSRSPFSSTYAQVNASGNQASVVATTIRPTSDYHAVIPAGSMQITVPKGETSIPFEGRTVYLLSVGSTTLRFRVD